jgi:DNA-binding NtrC family response regulator
VATILLVEDEEPLRDCVSQILVLSGHTVYQATGCTVLTTLEECPTAIEMLIADVLMPGMNGVEVAVAVLNKHPGIPIILISGYGEKVMDRFPDAPKAIFVAKPFSLSELVRIVTTIITLRSIKRSPDRFTLMLSLRQQQLSTLKSTDCTLSPELTASYVLDELDEQESNLYEAHYFSCPVCAKRIKEFSEALDAVRLFFPPRWIH